MSIISFSATSKYPNCLLSNFYGDAEIHFMAARFQNPEQKAVIVDNFAKADEAQFRHFFTKLYPTGKPATYIRVSPSGEKVIARGILARLVGTAAVSSTATAKRRMKVFNVLAGLPENHDVPTNTAHILAKAGLDEDATRAEQEDAILKFNTSLMAQCLEDKFQKGRCAENGIEFRQLLIDTEDSRLRERSFGRGSRWSGHGENDGLLGELLMKLRSILITEAEGLE